MGLERLHALHNALAVKRALQVRREEYLDYMTFRARARPLFTELFGPMVGLKEEWAAQGATPAELDLSAFPYRQPLTAHLPLHLGWLGDEAGAILEENAEHILARDHMGRTVKLCKGSATLPLPLDYPVRTMDDWRRVKPHYLFAERRFGDGWEAAARERAEQGYVIAVSIPGGFDEPRQLLGEEQLCLAFYEQPEMIQDMLQTIGDTAIRVLERVSARVQIDLLVVHEDMAGKSGSLIGPDHIRAFVAPYYRRIWDLLAARGARLFDQDSDGNMNSVIPAFLEAGVNVIHPLEPAAGMDIVRLREQYGTRLAFVGGLDKHVLRRTKNEIVRELEYKIPPMVRTGGCLLSLDHRIPNGTPLEHYRFYIRKVWDILGREASAAPHGNA